MTSLEKARDQQIRLFLVRLRNTHRDFEFLFTNGGCYHLYLILRSLWPEAELWHTSDKQGHVWSKIGDYWYDIRGRRITRPKGAQRVTAARLGRPDKWKHRFQKIVDARNIAAYVALRMRQQRLRDRQSARAVAAQADNRK